LCRRKQEAHGPFLSRSPRFSNPVVHDLWPIRAIYFVAKFEPSVSRVGNRPSLPPSQSTDPSRLSADDRRARSNYWQPDPDVDAIWRTAIGLDLEDRSVLEAEVLLWRICSAKSVPPAAIFRALFEDLKF